MLYSSINLIFFRCSGEQCHVFRVIINFDPAHIFGNANVQTHSREITHHYNIRRLFGIADVYVIRYCILYKDLQLQYFLSSKISIIISYTQWYNMAPQV